MPSKSKKKKDRPETSEPDPLVRLDAALAQRKGVLSRHTNALENAIAAGLVSEVQARIPRLSSTFAQMEEMVDSMERVPDWFADTQKFYFRVVKEASDWVEARNTSLKHPSQTQSDVSSLSSSMAQLVSLPRIEIEPFDGDPMKYHAFCRAFRINVEQVSSDADANLARLLSCTTGLARDAIQGTRVIGGVRGFDRAKAILKELFGSRQVIVQEVMNELDRKCKPLKTASHVREYSFALGNAYDILSELDALCEVNSQIILRKFVSNLPRFAQNKWCDMQLESRRRSDRYLGFSEFVDFVRLVADGMSDPICGQAARAQLNSPKVNADRSVQNFAVTEQGDSVHADKPKGNQKSPPSGNAEPRGDKVGQASQNSSPSVQNGKNHPRADRFNRASQCVLCNDAHPLSRCLRFRNMNVSERARFVEEQKVCSNCLRVGHEIEQCLSNNRCLICKAKHSVFLHVDGAFAHATSGGPFFMPVVKVLVNGERWANAALDTCSCATFCTEAFSKTLSNTVSEVRCSSLETILGKKTMNSRFISCELSKGAESVVVSGVRIVDRIPVACGPIDLSRYSHLQGMELSASSNLSEVDMLIGQDCADAMIPMAVKKGNPGEPFAVLYKFGWALHGSNQSVKQNSVSYAVICNFVSSPLLESGDSAAVERLKGDLSQLWAIEQGDDHVGLSVDDKAVIDLWDRSCIQDQEGHFVLPIPWRNPTEPLPNNLCVAQRRLSSLMRRLGEEHLYERYDNEISKLLNEGYAEVVPLQAINGSGRVWYLPHHHVLNPNKPGKVRVVFDCASRFKGKSLNERCLQGPNFINPLLDVLLRFREHSFAIQADIQAMYNQVRIPEHDRDALRFIWIKDGQIIHLRMTAHLFGGIWCSAVSSYALRRTVSKNPLVHPLVKHVVLKCMYVDDCLVSTYSDIEAGIILKELPKVLQAGGFTLTKFVVNHKELIEGIPYKHRAKELLSFPDAEGKALGVKWDVGDDSFGYEIKASEESVTKRSMLKFVASVFDPLGLALPWTVKGRMLFQDATRAQLEWDDEVPISIATDWKIWCHSLKALSYQRFPRSVQPRLFDGYAELHVFSDASQHAFGACAFLRCITPSGQITVRLIMAKSHVAPIKQMTIPRLELQAACTAAKLAASIKRGMDLSMVPMYFWTDSRIVLGYITNSKRRFRSFVSNRVSTIHSLSSPSDWRYVSSQENPADILTRPQFCDDRIPLWKGGPQWLAEPNAFWCQLNPSFPIADESDPEICALTVNESQALIASGVDRLIGKHSEWRLLRRSVAWLRRWFKYLRDKSSVMKGRLTAEELITAESAICGYVQRKHYPRSDEAISKSSPIFALRPFFDPEEVVRVGGRTGYHPVIMPHDNHASKLLARHFHERSHAGIEWSLSLLREKFWITKGRRVMTQLVRACVTCKKLKARPAVQLMSDLPAERIAPGLPAFSYVGVDVFGPYDVAVWRSTVKRYGCLFTCMVCRAIHIEVLESLDVHSFLNALRRFIARRGAPIKMYSDNGTNFVAGQRELREAFTRYTRTELQRYGAENGIAWSFNPPSAPHMGGVWERLIGVVKSVLRCVLGRASLTDEIFSTVLCEVEAIVNGRPLTKLSDDPNDLTPLTPNHLLHLKGSISLPPGVTSADSYRHRWKFVHHLANQFWSRFIKEYLPELQRRCKWTKERDSVRSGELVMVRENGVPRHLWPLAIVTKVFPGRDNRVRSVEVKTKSSCLSRPIVDIVRLEIDAFRRD